MADGSPEDRTGPKQMNDLTFSAPGPGHSDTKKCSGKTFDGERVKLSFYTELETSDSCEKSDTRGVAANSSTAVDSTNSRKSREEDPEHGDDRKKRCFDRYDSSESSDSGVAVLSPTESGGCSGSDITEPGSPRSPESGCSTAEEGSGAGARMPPWASDPAPPAPRRLPAQPAPARRVQPPIHRRITEYFNHKMKPQNGLKRDHTATTNEDTKRKCLPKNGVTHDLEKYISYLSQTLSPKVLMDVAKAETAAKKPSSSTVNGVVDVTKPTDLSKNTLSSTTNGILDLGKAKEIKEQNHTNMNGFVDIRHATESFTKEKTSCALLNGLVDGRKRGIEKKITPDPSASCNAYTATQTIGAAKRKVAKPMTNELIGVKIAPAAPVTPSSPKPIYYYPDSTKANGIVSSTTKLDIKINGVTCGSNNLSLNSKTTVTKKEALKKTNPQTKRTNRKSSACIANSKNLTWSKANNLKQVQLQQQNCVNSMQGSPMKNMPGEANTAPKMTNPNGVRQVPITMNGNLGNLNVPVNNLQNCHINIPQPCNNGTVNSNNLASFVAVPQNVMLTTLRIPQNGLPAPTLTPQSNMAAFNRQNVNVSSPTKLNGQFVFPLVQNINGTVVQIPNLMAKMPNFVLPQTPQLTPRQDHLQNQQAAQILINGTFLKLANTMTSPYPNVNNVNKTAPVTSQSIPVMNKHVPGLQPVGMSVQPKQNYTVNFSHPVLMPQPGFIVTSVPNMNVKETWSYTNTNSLSSPQTSCSNPIVHHPPPMVANFTTQHLHTSSIPIAPVKPPDNPIQGTEPPSSTVKEPTELSEVTSSKCDIPWLSKTVNNNIVPLDSNKITSRPFAQVSCLSEKLDELKVEKVRESKILEEDIKTEDSTEDLMKIEEVERREDTIFTQITVLKDVSSNVQNTVIEANFCSTTTQSSDSGIGTDKSIDSPSDSQTSKECDDDSSLSLSVSVCSEEVQSSQKSPILKQPKTLRFPPRILTKNSNKRTSSTDTSTVTVCLWENCKRELESDTDLLEHLQSVHVESQEGQESYVCLWEQCKVRGKPSCSRLWLQRHTLSHGGNKPFKCIVDGCDRRFSTQILLERHVNNHFNEVSPGANGNKKAADSASKLIRRNGKKLRYRRQPWSARMFDFFDAGMMEGLAWRLARCTRWRLRGACPLREGGARHALTLHAHVTATRYNHAAEAREALITYVPPHVIEDEWVPEKEVRRVKKVEIASLPVEVKVRLYEQFCESYRGPEALPARAPLAPKARMLPNQLNKTQTRSCTSSRLLNNLLTKKKRPEAAQEPSPPAHTGGGVVGVMGAGGAGAVSGARKRKMGRRAGGHDAFLPAGR